MKNYDFDWQINEFMIYCRSTQLRERTIAIRFYNYAPYGVLFALLLTAMASIATQKLAGIFFRKLRH